ncbi:hypothetical protein [Paenibacillus crassostreae]|uniref:Uncharacterized protein n=1 Tax=Paenibacillus crassostreae TaxID=1763538 RepID=A0A167FD11_9BACL|nr:hypothetical protein [Paenibacillus crassostreae]AOZ90808.1 hypothetical protein LPB68_00375 [Paenibacillus crassostreae]OAB76426.1 hypothetical protein PNBC_03155 [Paenibacillus crassostreae]
MKVSKTAKTAAIFGIGACIFVTTAFADMALGSGYDKLKSSAKYTTSQLENGLNNFTVEQTMSVTLDDEIVQYHNWVLKTDNVNKRTENVTVSKSYNEDESEYYAYDDMTHSAYKDRRDNQLYVTEYSSNERREDFYKVEDLFQEEGAVEIEKIIDAVVGNLKDLVQVDKNKEGNDTFSGSLNTSQVPALVNGVSSFGIKQIIGSEHESNQDSLLPKFTSDIYVTSVEGFASENEQGILTHSQGSVSFSGKDINGQEHQIDVSISIDLKDINSTVVTPPDFTNGIVNQYDANSTLNEKYEGAYVNNIVIQEGSDIIKIGERKLVLEEISDNQIIGNLEETVYEGYEKKYESKSLTFTKIEQNNYQTIIDYVDQEGNTGSAFINRNEGLDSIYFIYGVNGDIQPNFYNGNYVKVFE